MIVEIMAESQKVEELDNLTFIKAMNLGLHDVLLNNLSFFGSEELNSFSRTCQYFSNLFFQELSARLFKHIASGTRNDCIAIGTILENKSSLLLESREVKESADNIINQITPYEFAVKLGNKTVVDLLNTSLANIGKKAIFMARNDEQFDVVRAIKFLTSQLNTEELRITVQKKILIGILFNIKDEAQESTIINFLIAHPLHYNILKQSYYASTLIKEALKGSHFSILQKILDQCPSWEEYSLRTEITYDFKQIVSSPESSELAMAWIKKELPKKEGFNESLLWDLLKILMEHSALAEDSEFLESFLKILEKKSPKDILYVVPSSKRLLVFSKIPSLLNKEIFTICIRLSKKEVPFFLQASKSIWIDYIHDLNFLCPLLKSIRHEEIRKIILNEKPDFWENLTANNLLQMVTKRDKHQKRGWFVSLIDSFSNKQEKDISIEDKAIYETLFSSNLLVKTIPPKELAKFIKQIPKSNIEFVLKLYFSNLMNNLENSNHFPYKEMLLLKLKPSIHNLEQSIRLIDDKYCELFTSFEENWLDAIVLSIQYLGSLVTENAKISYQQSQNARLFKTVELKKFNDSLEDLKITCDEIPLMLEKSSCNIL